MFWLALFHSMCYFFFIYWSSFLSLCTVFDSISSKIDKVLSVNPCAKVFVFADFNAYYQDWLTYSGGTDRPGELCYNFSISNDLTQMVNFSTRIPDCDSQSCSFGFMNFFWRYLFNSGFFSIGKCCLSFWWFSIKFTMGCIISLHSLWLFFGWLRRSSWSFERYSMQGYL